MEERKARYFFDLTISENVSIAHIDGNEVFRLTFNPQNFAENFYKSVPVPKPPEGVTNSVRSLLEQHDVKRSNEEIDAAVQEASIEVMNVVFKAQAGNIAVRISENLHRLLVTVIEDAVKAFAVEGSIELNKEASRTVDISKLKDAILRQQWARIRDLAGIKQGGARKRKGFVWTTDRKTSFYQQVESQIRIENDSLWQYTLDNLIEQEFDTDTIAWLKSRPALKDVPGELFGEAIKTWRKYLERENWSDMRPEEKPRAFEYRHALHVLDYPDKFKFSTLDSHYYAGKKLSVSQK